MVNTLPPYYHPTTICFVDDNYSFLRSLSLDLPNSWSFISFLSPEEALAAVNAPDTLSPLVDRCFSMDRSSPNTPVIHFNLSALEQEIKLVERFRRISVLLVDYAMPNMDGLEFCAKVKNKHIQKALLTGVADEKTAVAAFNEGIIDRYIPKASLTSLNYVIPHVESLKQAYFTQYTARLSANLALNPPAFLTEPKIQPYFQQIVDQHNIVEFYLTGEPYGYLMLRGDGSIIRLVVLSQAELDEQIQVAQRYNAPSRLLAELKAGKQMGYLYEHPADYLGHEDYPWAELFMPAHKITGSHTWYLGVAENPPVDIDFDPAISSYDKFLTLDRPVV
jgi:CheY-like chemotaxis protein